MYRAIPVPSKILAKKEIERTDKILYEKLKSIKNRKSNYKKKSESRGRHSMLIKNNYYKNQRDLEINRENRILAAKMMNLEIQTKYKKKNSKRVPLKRKKIRTSKSKGRYHPRSLNSQKRKKEMLRITMDNITLMNRIQSMKSFYNPKEISRHNKRHQKLLELHCEFPMVIEKKNMRGKFFSDESEVKKTKNYRIKRRANHTSGTTGFSRGSIGGYRNSGKGNLSCAEHSRSQNQSRGSSLRDERSRNRSLAGQCSVTIHENTLNYRKKIYNCKVVKISEHNLKIYIDCHESSLSITKEMFDHIYTNKMEQYDFNNDLLMIKLIKEAEKKMKDQKHKFKTIKNPNQSTNNASLLSQNHNQSNSMDHNNIDHVPLKAEKDGSSDRNQKKDSEVGASFRKSTLTQEDYGVDGEFEGGYEGIRNVDEDEERNIIDSEINKPSQENKQSLKNNQSNINNFSQEQNKKSNSITKRNEESSKKEKPNPEVQPLQNSSEIKAELKEQKESSPQPEKERIETINILEETEKKEVQPKTASLNEHQPFEIEPKKEGTDEPEEDHSLVQSDKNPIMIDPHQTRTLQDTLDHEQQQSSEKSKNSNIEDHPAAAEENLHQKVDSHQEPYKDPFEKFDNEGIKNPSYSDSSDQGDEDQLISHEKKVNELKKQENSSKEKQDNGDNFEAPAEENYQDEEYAFEDSDFEQDEQQNKKMEMTGRQMNAFQQFKPPQDNSQDPQISEGKEEHEVYDDDF